MKLAQCLVRLYPKVWRNRYEEEFLVLLEQQPLSLPDGIDLCLGALDAHLHPHFGITSLSVYERIRQMLASLRGSLLTIFCAYSGFIIAGISFQKLNEYRGFVDAAQTYGIVGLSFHLVMIGAVIALLAVMAGGIPIAVAIVRDAFARKQYGLLFLLAAPILALAVFLGATLLLKGLIPVGAPTLQTVLSRGIFVAVFLGAAIVSAGALCYAVVRSEISEQLLRFAVLPAILLAFAMAVMLAATLIWGLDLLNSAPHLFNNNEGLFGTSTIGSWLTIVIEMAIATALAMISLVRGLSARSALPTAMA
jgi:hypothetical protein